MLHLRIITLDAAAFRTNLRVKILELHGEWAVKEQRA